MTKLISDGIDEVLAFELSAGIRADGDNWVSYRVCLVRWRSSLSGKFHQVYADGRYAGTTVDTEQRQMAVRVRCALESAVRIEVFGVDAEQAYMDFSEELTTPFCGAGRVKISLFRSQDLPVDATVQFYFDNGTGDIDYNNVISEAAIRIWPSWRDKAGFGMSGFGEDDFGLDWSNGVGFGDGVFGEGWFGIDADLLEWVSPAMSAGVYKFGVKVFDSEGNESEAVETGEVTVTPSAIPADQILVQSFDKQTNQLVLGIL
jgi:hypothetical protein